MAVMTEQQKEQIKAIICDVLELEPDELSETGLFVEEHGADSLRAIEILAELERALKVRLGQEDLARMTTLQNVYQVVEEAAARACA